jgi:hypothetical protein
MVSARREGYCVITLAVALTALLTPAVASDHRLTDPGLEDCFTDDVGNRVPMSRRGWW